MQNVSSLQRGLDVVRADDEPRAQRAARVLQNLWSLQRAEERCARQRLAAVDDSASDPGARVASIPGAIDLPEEVERVDGGVVEQTDALNQISTGVRRTCF